MPLEWGHGMNDPAAELPNVLIAAVPMTSDLYGDRTRLASVSSPATGTEQV
jgi:hypothetical protein